MGEACAEFELIDEALRVAGIEVYDGTDVKDVCT